MKVNIIVLNYNGQDIIPKCLPSIIEASKVSEYDVRVSVIDNESTDNSMEVLKAYAGDIDIIPCENKILCSFNEVVEKQPEEIAILLNNDMRLDPGFIDPMMKVFEENRDAFMVVPKCFDFPGRSLEGGRSKGFIKFGWFGAMAKFPGWKEEVDDPGYSFQSGFGAVRKDRFVELGGYDDLYAPGRLEDSDLCFRAWKRGWKSYYQPLSYLYHMGGETFNREFGKEGVSSIDSRNSLLFFWKNISDPVYWLKHLFFLPARCIYWFIRGERAAVRGLFSGLFMIPRALEKRKSSGKAFILNDRKIFDMFR